MKKALLLPIIVFAITSCGNASPTKSQSKYGANKFITEQGTCYVISGVHSRNVVFHYVILRADGTGSAYKADTNDSYVSYGWELAYILDKENNLYIPYQDGYVLTFKCSVNETTKFREISYGGGTYVEFTEESLFSIFHRD